MEKNGSDTQSNKPQFHVNLPGIPSFFVDHIYISATGEQVQLIGGQKGPRPEDDINPVVRLYLTVPHFMRLVEVFNKIKNDVEKILNEQVKVKEVSAK